MYNEFNRLIIAKQMYLKGNEYSIRSDSISKMQAILSWDQSIEIFLKSSPSISSSTPQPKNDLLFPDLIKPFSNYSTFAHIKSLHYLRNAVQHYGNVPSSVDVDKYKVHAADFIDELCSKEFKLTLSQISLTHAIKTKELQDMLLESEQLFDEDKYDEAYEKAFEALSEATFTKSTIFELSGELIGLMGASTELKTVIDSKYFDDFKQDMYYKPIICLSRAISQLGQAASSIHFLGAYKTDFLRFMRCNKTRENMDECKLKEEVEFSINFVTNIIIYWEEERVIE